MLNNCVIRTTRVSVVFVPEDIPGASTSVLGDASAAYTCARSYSGGWDKCAGRLTGGKDKCTINRHTGGKDNVIDLRRCGHIS